MPVFVKASRRAKAYTRRDRVRGDGVLSKNPQWLRYRRLERLTYKQGSRVSKRGHTPELNRLFSNLRSARDQALSLYRSGK